MTKFYGSENASAVAWAAQTRHFRDLKSIKVQETHSKNANYQHIVYAYVRCMNLYSICIHVGGMYDVFQNVKAFLSENLVEVRWN